MRVTPQRPADPVAVVDLGETGVAATDVHRSLFDPDALGESLLEAVAELNESRPYVLADDLSPLYASAVGRLRRGAPDDPGDRVPRRIRFLQFTRYLDNQPAVDSFADAVETGPVALLATLDTRPVAEIRIPKKWVSDTSSTEIRRLMKYLRRLTPGVDVRLTGSRIDLRELVERHGADLPADVSESARSRLRQRAHAGRSPSDVAREAIEEIGTSSRQAGYWRLLELVVDDNDPHVRLALLEQSALLDVSASAVRKRVSRLVEAALLERHRINGDVHLRPTAAAHEALEIIRDRSPSLLGGRATGDHSSESETSETPTNDAVNNPRNNPRDRVNPYAQDGRPDGDPQTAGGQTVTGGGSMTAPAETSHEHHRAAAAAPAEGGVGLVNRPVEAGDDRRDVDWYRDEDRNEVVVSVKASPAMAILAVRLCSALLDSKATSKVLTPENLDGGPAGQDLEGLAINNPYVLRRGRTIGWLRDVDAEGGRLLDRLGRAHGELLEDLATAAENADSGVYDDDDLRNLLRRAHGLMGVLVALYDLLGYDVVREIRLPEPGGIDADDLAEFVHRSLSISSRYGAYTAHRVLYEGREEKREDALGAPEVDVDEPSGTVSGSFVLVGAGVDRFRPYLERPAEYLELQEGAANFEPFTLDVEIADGDRREAHAEMLARMEQSKGLEATRTAIDVLRSLTGSLYDTAEAVSYMGQGEGRDLDWGDLRWGLSRIDRDRLLPDLGGSTVSSVVGELLERREVLNTRELAEAAGVTERSIQQNREFFEQLAGAGLLVIDEGGPGEATRWSFRFPGEGDSVDYGGVEPALSGSTLGFRASKGDSGPLDRRLTDALHDAVAVIGDGLGRPPPVDLAGDVAMAAFSGVPPDRDLGPLLEAAPEIEGLARLLASLLDQEERLPDGDGFRGSLTTLGKAPEVPTTQTTIEAAG